MFYRVRPGAREGKKYLNYGNGFLSCYIIITLYWNSQGESYQNFQGERRRDCPPKTARPTDIWPTRRLADGHLTDAPFGRRTFDRRAVWPTDIWLTRRLADAAAVNSWLVGEFLVDEMSVGQMVFDRKAPIQEKFSLSLQSRHGSLTLTRITFTLRDSCLYLAVNTGYH